MSGPHRPRFANVLLDELRAILSAGWSGARYGAKIRAPHALVMTFLFRDDLSSRDKVRNVLRMAVEHAGNLAAFAAMYKALLAALKWTSSHCLKHDETTGPAADARSQSLYRSLGRKMISLLLDGPTLIHLRRYDSPLQTPAVVAPPGHAEHAYHSFLAGAVGGYCVWGRYSSINYQIVLYLTSRILVGIGKKIVARAGGRNNDSCPREGSQETRSYYPLAAALVWGTVMALFEESPEVLHPTLRASMDEIYRSRALMPPERTQISSLLVKPSII
jgi:peroxisomal membrane protein 4